MDATGTADRFRYELDPGESISNDIVTVVSAVVGAALTLAESMPTSDTLLPPYTVVDPYALAHLFRPTTNASVVLTYAGCRVVTDSVVVVTVRLGAPAETPARDDGFDEANLQ